MCRNGNVLTQLFPNSVQLMDSTSPNPLTHKANMIVQHAQADPASQLLDLALPEIARLGASLAQKHEASQLAVNSPKLLDALANLNRAIVHERERMDAIDIISPRLWEYEEFHSRILNWLLDPSSRHRQSGCFTAALLNATKAPPQLLAADWNVAQILQEWENEVDGHKGYLDILILNQEYQSLIAIENKTFSQEHSNQLTRYRLALENVYPDYARHHVFLSPSGVSPYRKRDRKYWRPASYSVIHDAIRQVLETGVADPDANALLQIYATTIRRNVMPDTSLKQQARRIYLEHREAIDLIFANKPNWVNETKNMLKEAVVKHSFWKLGREDSHFVRFRAADWEEFPSSWTGTGWAPRSNALLLFQIRFYNERPYLDLGLSPTDPINAEIRSALFDAVRQNPAVFKLKNKSLIEGWMILHEEPDYILEPADYGPGLDDGSVRRKIEAWIDKFAAEQFPEMNRIIVDCLRRHQEA